MEEKLRYSDEELEEFRKIIQDKLQVARHDYDVLLDQLSNRNNNGIDDTMPTYHVLEEGSETQSKEALISMAARSQTLSTPVTDATKLDAVNSPGTACKVCAG